MLRELRCTSCKHFLGNTTCAAFLERILREISSDLIPHFKYFPGQEGDK